MTKRASSGESGKPSRGAATRRLILASACAEFARKGYEGGTLRSVARAAGVELGLLQYHFSDKMGLWEAVLDDVFTAFHVHVDGVIDRCAGRHPAEVVANIIEAFIRHADSDPVFVGIMSHARQESSPYGEAMRRRFGASAERIIEWIEAAQMSGAMTPGRSGLLFYQVVGAILRTFMLRGEAQFIAKAPLTDHKVIDEHVHMSVRHFLPDLILDVDGEWRFPRRERSLLGLVAEPPPSHEQSDHVSSGLTSTAFLISVADTALQRRLSEGLQALGLTYGQAIALLEISNHPDPSLTQLAGGLSVTTPTAAKFLKALEQMDLATRSVDPGNRRRRPIELTAQGKQMASAVHSLLQDADQWLLGALPFEARSALRRALASIIQQ